MIGQACRQAGYEVQFEDNGGLTDGRRPGDVRVRRWKLGKDLLIDCAIIDPTVETHYNNLVMYGAGEAATGYEQVKLDRYPDIDPERFDFVPFIVETHGAFGDAALRFSKELHKRKLEKSYAYEASHWRLTVILSPISSWLNPLLLRYKDGTRT